MGWVLTSASLVALGGYEEGDVLLAGRVGEGSLRTLQKQGARLRGHGGDFEAAPLRGALELRVRAQGLAIDDGVCDHDDDPSLRSEHAA